jgi:hypothetical protein
MKKHRPDITHALIHLIGDRRSTGGLSADEALYSILRGGVIKGSGEEGFIKGPNRAVCLTEMPLSSVKYFVQNTYHKHNYKYFGIALSKVKGWKAGARPVIYLPDDEANWIPDDERWRHMKFNFGDVDFTHEREWRMKGDLKLQGFGFYVIVPNREYEKRVLEINPKCVKSIIGFLHMDYLNDLL